MISFLSKVLPSLSVIILFSPSFIIFVIGVNSRRDLIKMKVMSYPYSSPNELLDPLNVKTNVGLCNFASSSNTKAQAYYSESVVVISISLLT